MALLSSELCLDWTQTSSIFQVPLEEKKTYSLQDSVHQDPSWSQEHSSLQRTAMSSQLLVQIAAGGDGRSSGGRVQLRSWREGQSVNEGRLQIFTPWFNSPLLFASTAKADFNSGDENSIQALLCTLVVVE